MLGRADFSGTVLTFVGAWAALTAVIDPEKRAVANTSRTIRGCGGIELFWNGLLSPLRFLIRLSSQSLGGKGLGQRRMNARLLRGQSDGATQLGNRLVQLILIHESFAERSMSAHKIRVDRHRLPKRLGGRLQLFLLQVSDSQVEGGLEVCAIQLQGTLQGSNRSVDPPGV